MVVQSALLAVFKIPYGVNGFIRFKLQFIYRVEPSKHVLLIASTDSPCRQHPECFNSSWRNILFSEFLTFPI